MKKILHVISSMNPKHGGVCQAVRSTVAPLQQYEVVTEVVCLDNPTDEYLKNDPFKIYALGEANGAWAYNNKLKNWLRDNILNYDVIIIDGLWLYHSYITIKTFNKLKQSGHIKLPPLYIMPHGMLDPWFQKDKSRRMKALRNELYWRFIEKNVVNSADGLLFTCEQELILARETFKGYKPAKEINVGLGTPSPPLQTEAMPPAFSEKPYFLFLSRIHPKKGVDLLISAYKQLKLEDPTIPELVIAGPLGSDYASKMQAIASGCKSIHFTGMLTGNAKWGAIYGAEAFILPSHQENFGIAVVEALACGIPVLISDQVNIWREIQKGEAGFVQSDTLKGTLDLLNTWLKTGSQQRKKMRQNAVEVYQDYFTVEAAAKRLKEMLTLEQ